MEAIDLNSEELAEEVVKNDSTAIEVFFDVLGLISLDFIESMTTFSGGGKKEPLTDMLVTYMSLDSNKKTDNKDNKKEDLKDEQVQQRAKILPFKADQQQEKSNKKCSTSSFIFEEKKKSEIIQRKMKGKEIIELYQKSSEINIKQEKALRDDLGKSYKIGILINKRQY